MVSGERVRMCQGERVRCGVRRRGLGCGVRGRVLGVVSGGEG